MQFVELASELFNPHWIFTVRLFELAPVSFVAVTVTVARFFFPGLNVNFPVNVAVSPFLRKVLEPSCVAPEVAEAVTAERVESLVTVAVIVKLTLFPSRACLIRGVATEGTLPAGSSGVGTSPSAGGVTDEVALP